MLEAALFRHDRIPGDSLDRRLDGVAFKVGNTNRIFVDDRDLAVAEEEDVARVLEIGGISEATKNSRSPRPITTGGPWRTAMIVSGSSELMIDNAKMPRSSRTAERTACSNEESCLRYSSIRWAMISVSVSVTKRWSDLRRRSLSCR
jgi:hypothetical protein